VVSKIGKWDSNPAGVATFTVTVPSAGQYTMTVYYVLTRDVSRDAQITVTAGSSSTTRTVNFLNTERPGSPATCVDPQPPMSVDLTRGTNTIRFANPNGKAPTLDKIVISRP
jgi:hypothetical protein